MIVSEPNRVLRPKEAVKVSIEPGSVYERKGDVVRAELLSNIMDDFVAEPDSHSTLKAAVENRRQGAVEGKIQ